MATASDRLSRIHGFETRSFHLEIDERQHSLPPRLVQCNICARSSGNKQPKGFKWYYIILHSWKIFYFTPHPPNLLGHTQTCWGRPTGVARLKVNSVTGRDKVAQSLSCTELKGRHCQNPKEEACLTVKFGYITVTKARWIMMMGRLESLPTVTGSGIHLKS